MVKEFIKSDDLDCLYYARGMMKLLNKTTVSFQERLVRVVSPSFLSISAR